MHNRSILSSLALLLCVQLFQIEVQLVTLKYVTITTTTLARARRNSSIETASVKLFIERSIEFASISPLCLFVLHAVAFRVGSWGFGSLSFFGGFSLCLCLFLSFLIFLFLGLLLWWLLGFLLLLVFKKVSVSGGTKKIKEFSYLRFLLLAQCETIVLFIPLTEGRSINLNDSVFHQGIGTNQLVVGCIVHHSENPCFTCDG